MNNESTIGGPAYDLSIKISYTTTGVSSALPLCSVVRLVSTTNCFVRISATGTQATANHLFLPAGIPEYFLTTQGYIVSAAQESAAGILYITPFQ